MSTRRSPFNLPNALTYARILVVPVVVGLLFWPEDFNSRWIALGFYTAAGITDFFDGYLARMWSQQTSMGRILDPIADKLLIGSVLMMLVYVNAIDGWAVWAAIVILCREMLVSGLREFLAEVRVSVPVSQLAKWKTTMQLIALGFLIAGPAGGGIDELLGNPVPTHSRFDPQAEDLGAVGDLLVELLACLRGRGGAHAEHPDRVVTVQAHEPGGAHHPLTPQLLLEVLLLLDRRRERLGRHGQCPQPDLAVGVPVVLAQQLHGGLCHGAYDAMPVGCPVHSR